jgi:hypothetical protein
MDKSKNYPPLFYTAELLQPDELPPPPHFPKTFCWGVLGLVGWRGIFDVAQNILKIMGPLVSAPYILTSSLLPPSTSISLSTLEPSREEEEGRQRKLVPRVA